MRLGPSDAPRALILCLLASCARAHGQAHSNARNPPASSDARAVVGAAAESPVCVASGVLERGRDRSPRRDETPRHTVRVEAFCMDATLVTRAQFARFVAATGYRTDAERRTTPMESLEGFGDWEWQRVFDGDWRRPFSVENADTRQFLADDAPVVMVSFHDANAYCAWRGGALPTEAQWEYAMRAGRAGERYPWGNSPTDDAGVPRLNYWQGASHARNDRLDPYVYVSPVRAFAPNAWGFYDPVGNVWQWTADPYELDTYARAAGAGRDAGAFDASATDASSRDAAIVVQRVTRGGSWWCAQCTCQGYGLWYRGHNDPSAAFSNLGFRCAYRR